MLIQTITMLWAPAGIVTDQTDMIIAIGSVIKDGAIVVDLPQVGVPMVNLTSLLMWELPTPIEADSVSLSLYNVDYQHTVDIDGIQFPIAPLDNQWQELSLVLSTPDSPDLPTPTPDSPVDMISAIIPIMIMIPMMAMMMKTSK